VAQVKPLQKEASPEFAELVQDEAEQTLTSELQYPL
jgi:hypothetical protein